MSDGKQFRKWAAQLARRAGEEPDAAEAQRLLSIAEYWVRLADNEGLNQPIQDEGFQDRFVGGFLLEDDVMEIAGQTRITAQNEVKNHDAMILLGYSIFASVLLIAIYLGSMSSGIAPGDLASMTVFS
jgi:hypothetical protein